MAGETRALRWIALPRLQCASVADDAQRQPATQGLAARLGQASAMTMIFADQLRALTKRLEANHA
jgi:hypothetical protein